MNERILTIGAMLAVLSGAVRAQDAGGALDDEAAIRSERLDRRGDRIDRNLDRRGSQIDRRMDRSGQRADRHLDRRAARAASRGN
ncbi:MAG: hypothetical protein PVF63_10785 [Gammaproteobacteria bacterium]